MGQIYQKTGLLYKGQVHEVDRFDLIGRCIGQTTQKVRDQIEKARGCILFIDEAYALTLGEQDSYGNIDSDKTCRKKLAENCKNK